MSRCSTKDDPSETYAQCPTLQTIYLMQLHSSHLGAAGTQISRHAIFIICQIALNVHLLGAQ